MDDPYDLTRYVAAQQPVFERVWAELASGHKQTHWMWFVFPQLRGLGSSSMAERYGISSLEEARAYLAHPLLGERLRRCTQLVNRVEGRSAEEIFGYPDYLKFRSCMTLFATAAAAATATATAAQKDRGAAGSDGGKTQRGAADPAADNLFRQALVRYFAGEGDPLTRRVLGQ